MPAIRDIEADVTFIVEKNPVLTYGFWECGDRRFFDPDGMQYEPIITTAPLTVDVITFKLLFTSQERIKAKELRHTDVLIDDFWSILDDPRSENVVMALPSIQDAIDYTLTAINAAGLTIDVAARKVAILSGQLI
ncbi:hypothetical protein [Nitrosomonas ureae]|uniref:Uncharacterized protein n=1 Tax=Nitrosomonas ureae TaxID=44577 RepID=A0A2T5ISL2_9PROT|nr:hypothetical protein [Nitrosomonas ureae]PTQ86828.1 hypothetical protein C8R28_100823 [Nitrosomonas ureae]